MEAGDRRQWRDCRSWCVCSKFWIYINGKKELDNSLEREKRTLTGDLKGRGLKIGVELYFSCNDCRRTWHYKRDFRTGLQLCIYTYCTLHKYLHKMYFPSDDSGI